MSSYLLLLATCLLLGDVTAAPNTPAPWKNWIFCKKSDPNKIDQCLIKAIQSAERDIIDGSSYFGLPKLNPLHLNELSMFQAGQDKSVAVNITFTNVTINGINSWDVTEARADWDTGNLYGVMDFAETVIFDADYTVNGKIILLPVRGRGKTRITFERMVAPLHIKGHQTERKGKRYFTVDTFDVVLNPKSATFRFGDLFNGQTALSDSINRALNENWEEVLSEVKRPVGEGLGAAFKQMSNRIFAKIPYDVLVPS